MDNNDETKKKAPSRTHKKQKNPSKQGVAFFITFYQEKHGLTTQDLANELGFARSYVSLVKNQFEGYEAPRELLKALYKLCNAEDKKFLMECVYREMDHSIID